MAVLIKGGTSPNQTTFKFAVDVPGSQGRPEFSLSPLGSWSLFSSDDYPVDTLGNWYHFVATYAYATPASANLYVNGVPAASNWDTAPVSNVVGQDDHPVIIGRNWPANDQHFSGAIDEVSVWRRELSPFEIQLMHAVQSAP